MGSLLEQLTKGGATAAPNKATTGAETTAKAETKTTEPSPPKQEGTKSATDALVKAKGMLRIGIEVHEIVNGLKAMFPDYSLDELGEIVALARATAPKAETKVSEPGKATEPVKEEPKAPEKTDEKDAPAKRGRPAKTETTTPLASFANGMQLQAKLADEIAALPASPETLRERVAMAALLLHGK